MSGWANVPVLPIPGDENTAARYRQYLEEHRNIGPSESKGEPAGETPSESTGARRRRSKKSRKTRKSKKRSTRRR